MKILALPSPHHWWTCYGHADVEGWAFDEHTGRIVPVIYNRDAGVLEYADIEIEPKAPARGQYSPYGKYMPDDPKALEKARKEAKDLAYATHVWDSGTCEVCGTTAVQFSLTNHSCEEVQR